MGNITTQTEFDQYFISSAEIITKTGVARSTLKHARESGRLPGAIEVNHGQLYVWVRNDVQTHLDNWIKKLQGLSGDN